MSAMPASVLVKICGITIPDDGLLAIEAGADFLGFIFFERSPRNVSRRAWAELSEVLPAGAQKVGVFVDASDEMIESVLKAGNLDWLQLHGKESPGRVADVKRRFGLPVMKAVSVREAGDLDVIDDYRTVADRFLFDAKPPADDVSLPGGNGLSFDWRLLQQANLDGIWALAGGLDVSNVRKAVTLTEAPMVDVSTGVEIEPGRKDKRKLQTLIEACKAMDRQPAV
jgi:phosphoribosylanthranilate isomerase